MDITDTLAPKSEQLDAVDLLSGPRVFTIKSVSGGSTEQPVNVHLVEFDRPWRPGVSMRRVLATCWGVETSAWIGRRVELFCDPAVRFGSDAVGGTRISRLSHIDKTKKIPLLIARGKSATYTVEPLAEPTTDERIASLRSEFRTADETRKAAILAEVETLQAVNLSVPVTHKFTGDADADACTVAGCGMTVDAECHA